mmetsp:Transcript_12048/g.48531  ORF Transcript_12048/g.48531 Transcript_12048/m.48531 type:complete len:208 (-) Transcript_12048:1603-2226(-)
MSKLAVSEASSRARVSEGEMMEMSSAGRKSASSVVTVSVVLVIVMGFWLPEKTPMSDAVMLKSVAEISTLFPTTPMLSPPTSMSSALKVMSWPGGEPKKTKLAPISASTSTFRSLSPANAIIPSVLVAVTSVEVLSSTSSPCTFRIRLSAATLLTSMTMSFSALAMSTPRDVNAASALVTSNPILPDLVVTSKLSCATIAMLPVVSS